MNDAVLNLAMKLFHPHDTKTNAENVIHNSAFLRNLINDSGVSDH